MPQERTTTDLLASELEELRALVAEQAEAIERLRQRIAGLETRLAKDSHKSSKPPSSDPPFRKPSPRAQRKASGRNRAGQKGHKGITRALLDAPDNLVVTALEGACACGCCRSQIDVERSPERRYGVELVLRPEGTEYRTVAATFACGRRHRSDFPEAVIAPLQEGPGMSPFAVYTTQYASLRFERTAAVLDELAGIAISPGSLLSMVATAAAPTLQLA